MGTLFLPRTCTESSVDDRAASRSSSHLPFERYREEPAIVLLGDPGAGKTALFKAEARASGGQFVTARDLITFDDRPEWRDAVLFIDGLDEVRAGATDARAPFDAIRTKLDRLGRPRFRLSCREADWRGDADRSALGQASPDGRIVELHLDPLDEAAVRELIAQSLDDGRVEPFLRTAREHGLEALFGNPQLLQLLVEAVRGGEAWPTTRAETFALACCRLASEHNREHADALPGSAPGLDAKVAAAGFLCAVLLLSGRQGVALHPLDADQQFPALEDVPCDDGVTLRAVLATKLFTRGDADGRRQPVHRTVAEFLAGKYLAAAAIERGLPVGRILSITTGADGGVVTELRGVHAWLTALCPQDRRELIGRDPLGIVLYGDVAGFTSEERMAVIDGLSAEARRYHGFRLGQWQASPFGALCTPEMEKPFGSILVNPDRTDAHQALVDCVIDAVAHAPPLPRLADTLAEVAEDKTRWRGVRREALDVLARWSDIDEDARVTALRSLGRIASGEVDNEGGELLGTLLQRLYPTHLSPARVLDYLHEPKGDMLLGYYRLFWQIDVLRKSSDQHCMELIDELTARYPSGMPREEGSLIDEFVSSLLARALDVGGDVVDDARLARWLAIGLNEYQKPVSVGSDLGQIRAWLATRPNRYKDVVWLGVIAAEPGKVDRISRLRCTLALLHGAKHPDDFGNWLLERVLQTDDPRIAEALLSEAANCLWWSAGDAGLQLGDFERLVETRPELHEAWDSLRSCCIPEWRQRDARRRREREQSRAEECARAQDTVIRHRESLESRGEPFGLLHAFCPAYFDFHMWAKGDSPGSRIAAEIGGDKGAAAIVLRGFRALVGSPDLPAAREVIAKLGEGREYVVGMPFLAGMQELVSERPAAVSLLDDDTAARAAAFNLVHATGGSAEWFTDLVRHRPQVVAEVFERYVAMCIRIKRPGISGLYQLAFDSEFAAVAGRCVPTLLRGFPLRARSEQLAHLDQLLFAGIAHVPGAVLLPIIESKLNANSMHRRQRVHWLAAGLFLDPAGHEAKLAAFVGNDRARIDELAAFLSWCERKRSLIGPLPEGCKGLLLRLLGAAYPPYTLTGASVVTRSMEMADTVKHLIAALAGTGTDAASEVLSSLLDSPSLEAWRERIRGALNEQASALRAARYVPPSPRAVCQTIAGRAPSSPADLSALVVGHLRSLGKSLRDGNENGYRRFWAGSGREAGRPLVEEACRDLLLLLLKPRLDALGVSAEPERRFADEKRSDIAVRYGGFIVPVEIKKNTHAKLWTAARDQLDRLYTRDPAAQRRGVYLVLWFGPAKTQPPPAGHRPKTAADLEARLRSELTADQRGRLDVCVMDVSWPER